MLVLKQVRYQWFLVSNALTNRVLVTNQGNDWINSLTVKASLSFCSLSLTEQVLRSAHGRAVW
jgi:hypothetical protein